MTFFQRFWILKGIKIGKLVQKLQWFCWMGGFCLLVELHWEGTAPAACAAALFYHTPHSTSPSFCVNSFTISSATIFSRMFHTARLKILFCQWCLKKKMLLFLQFNSFWFSYSADPANRWGTHYAPISIRMVERLFEWTTREVERCQQPVRRQYQQQCLPEKEDFSSFWKLFFDYNGACTHENNRHIENNCGGSLSEWATSSTSQLFQASILVGGGRGSVINGDYPI